jgi:hypothetical protein
MNQNEHIIILQQQVKRIEKGLELYLHNAQKRFESFVKGAPEQVPAEQIELMARWYMKEPEWTRHALVPEDDEEVGIPAHSRLALLIENFKLSSFERDALLLCLMPLISSNSNVLFACLQNNEQAQWPTSDLILNLLSESPFDKATKQIYLSSQSTLLRYGLIEAQDSEQASWQQICLRGRRDIYQYLCGHDVQANSLHSRWVEPSWLPDTLPSLTAQLVPYCSELSLPTLLISLQGDTDSGRKMALARAAAKAGRRTLLLDLGKMPADAIKACALIVQVLSNAMLYAACLILKDLPVFFETHSVLKGWLSERLAEYRFPLFCLSESNTPVEWLDNLSQVVLQMPVSTIEDEVTLLRRQLDNYSLAGDVDPDMLIRRFRPQPENLLDSLKEADFYRRFRGNDQPLCNDDLRRAFSLRSQQAFGKLARRIEPVRGFDDLVISDELRIQLDEILAAIRQRERILAQGFVRKIGYGTGISVLFHGDSGTGKTLVAEVLANTLGVDMIKVDLATVVNRYIGETEKNLARIFDHAEADSGLLFFDEADALFGKRSETKDAHDRYANIEISYLLQRLENYPGLVVLATNNRTHLDEAFTRRLTFIVRFPFPDKTMREQLWRNIWPSRVKLDKKIDFAALAHREDLTGANIRNVAMLATWLAADAQAPCVQQKHIDRALKRELSKLGRVYTQL